MFILRKFLKQHSNWIWSRSFNSLTDESNKLYIASGSGTPLIKGDFAAKTVNISGIATSLTGSLLGTATTASYVENAQTASFVHF
jgi:hypothetical protein